MTQQVKFVEIKQQKCWMLLQLYAFYSQNKQGAFMRVYVKQLTSLRCCFAGYCVMYEMLWAVVNKFGCFWVRVNARFNNNIKDFPQSEIELRTTPTNWIT